MNLNVKYINVNFGLKFMVFNFLSYIIKKGEEKKDILL